MFQSFWLRSKWGYHGISGGAHHGGVGPRTSGLTQHIWRAGLSGSNKMLRCSKEQHLHTWRGQVYARWCKVVWSKCAIHWFFRSEMQYDAIQGLSCLSLLVKSLLRRLIHGLLWWCPALAAGGCCTERFPDGLPKHHWLRCDQRGWNSHEVVPRKRHRVAVGDGEMEKGWIMNGVAA